MSNPFLAEIRIFPFSFAPQGWALCDGQLLPISQNTALFSLLGTTYGGNGTSNFALPDLQGRMPMHPSQGAGPSLHNLGETGGSDTVTLLQSEIPVHTHTVNAASSSVTPLESPTGALPGAGHTRPYGDPAGLTGMAATALQTVGGDQPHNNLSPYLVFNFCIAMQGIFPARS